MAHAQPRAGAREPDPGCRDARLHPTCRRTVDVTVVARGPVASGPAPSRVHGRVRQLARRHRGLLALLVLGGGIRTVAVVAYSSALWFPDSSDYYRSALLGQPAVHRPFGYSALLAALVHLHLSFRAVAVVQHLLGLVTVVVVYALLVRRGVPRWGCLLAVLPLALDGFVVDIEQVIVAETLFLLLLAVGLYLVLSRARPGAALAGTAGVVIGLVTVTRTVGTFIAGVLVVYLVVRVLARSIRWTALAGFVTGLALVLLPYATWFATYHDSYALTSYSGHFLYGRVSNFVDCDRTAVPDRLRGLCPAGRPDERPDGDQFVWGGSSPANRVVNGRPLWSNADLKEFSVLAITSQPRDFVALTVSSTLHYLLPGRSTGPKDVCPDWWDFPLPTDRPSRTCSTVLAPTTRPAPASQLPPERACLGEFRCDSRVAFALDPGRQSFRPGHVTFLRNYQAVLYTPGPVLGLCVVAGLLALAGPRGVGGVRDRLDPALLAVLGVVVLAVPSATSSFDYRYMLPTLVVLPAAAALAALRLRARSALPGDSVPT